MVALAAVAWWGLAGITSVTDSIDGSVTPRLIAVDDVRAAAADMHFSQTRAVLDGTTASRGLQRRPGHVHAGPRPPRPARRGPPTGTRWPRSTRP